jgi:hypothetical protein
MCPRVHVPRNNNKGVICVHVYMYHEIENLHYYSTVNVGGYEPTKVVITLGRGVYTLHLYYYFVF